MSAAALATFLNLFAAFVRSRTAEKGDSTRFDLGIALKVFQQCARTI